MNRSLWKKAFFLTLEYLGVFTVVFAFLIFFRPARFLAKYLSQKPPASILSDWFLSGIRWTAICLVTVIVVLIIRKIKANWTLGDLGFRTHRKWHKDIRFGIVIFSLAHVISLPQTIAVFPSKAKLAGESLLKEWTGVSSPLHILLLAWLLSAFGTFMCALWEEIYWRGYLQNLFSRAFAPAVGFFVSMIFFGPGHYFTRPEWGPLDVVGSTIGGITFGLAFYATGSLLATTVIHTLSNLWWDYPLVLYLQGQHKPAYVFIIVLWIATLVVCILGRKEIAFLLKKSKELFVRSGWKMRSIGILLAAAAILYDWGQAFLRAHIKLSSLRLLLITFSIIAIVLSFFYKEKNSPQAG